MKPNFQTTFRILRLLAIATTVVGLLFASAGHKELEECAQESVVVEAELFSTRDEEASAPALEFSYHIEHAKASNWSVQTFSRVRKVRKERDRLNGRGTYLLV